MGYRNYFYITEKKKVDDFLALSHEEQMKATAEVIKKDYNNNILVMYKDSGTWANWTLKDRGTLTNAYNLIVDGLLENKKLITISEGLE